MKDEELTDEQKAGAKAEAIRRLQPEDRNDDAWSEVTGDFDENLDDISNPSLEKLLKAGTAGGNGHNHKLDNNVTKDKDTNKKPKYSTYKYSTRLRGKLHEAVLLNGEPVFLTYSGHLNVVKQIEEVNRILVPPCIEEYPYDPIEFDSVEEINKFVERAKKKTIDTLYQNVKNTVILYVDQDEEIQNLIAADILWTYFQDLFPTTHYYDIVGRATGIGKSSIGYMFEGLAYRCVRMTDPSAANLYRVLERIEPGQCTMVLDEADRIQEDRYMMAILKEGYAIGGKVPKINMNTGKQEWFFSYCFKIRIAEDPLSPSSARGLIDRMFVIRAKTAKQFDNDEVSIQTRLDNSIINAKSQRYSVTPSRPENDVNITGVRETDKEIAKRTFENDKKLVRDDVTMVTVALLEKPSIYRIGSTDQYGCNDCKLKGDKWFMQSHNCSSKKIAGNGKSKSKIAEAAKANQSGNGIMPENGQGKQQNA